ncbi:hypothetical protein QBC40DRAFT_95005 [Triangularia verruculosa]|uniref:Rhodopsin domain-containing protein n=1 Tax=Triangularia verruculosa TaxID=2587418 RepID=A0AAN6XCJ4_9PEZI|nr:hypothetical protein QBC40DRAFT_95005 [Triangularia verruculosa]
MGEDEVLPYPLPGTPEWEALPHDTRGPSMLIAAWGTFAVAAIFVALRFWTRIRIIRMVGSADWLILLSLIGAGAMCASMTFEVRYGSGKHIWDIPPENFSKMMKTWYFSLLWYAFSLGFSKMSICVIYVTIFTYEWAKRCSWAMLIFVIIHNLWALAMMFTFCIPLQAIWNPDVKPSFCHPEAVWWANTSLVVLSDFLIFFLPVPSIVPLKLPRRQKIAVVAVFAVGFFICVVSVVRIIIVIHRKSSSDIDHTYHNAVTNHWTSLEVHTSIVVACAMTLKPLVTHLFPNLLEPRSGETTAEPSHGVTIGSMPLRHQPTPIRASTGGWLEVAAEENKNRRDSNNDTNKDDNVIEDVALRHIDIEAQTHHQQHQRPRKSSAAEVRDKGKKELESISHSKHGGSIIEDLAGLRPVSRPYAKTDAASVSTQASLLGPEVTVRSMG